MNPMIAASVALASVLAFAVIGAVALFKFTDHHQQRIALEFKEACETKSGRAVWNGRYWECLR